MRFITLCGLVLSLAMQQQAFGQGIYKGGPGGGFATTGVVPIVSSIPEFVTIHPNPVEGPNATLQLFSKYAPLASFQVIDSYGKELFSVKNFPPKSNRLLVAIGRLAPGLYSAKLRLANGKTFVQKLVRQ